MANFVKISPKKQVELFDKKQRSKHLFNNDTLSDVKFVVRAFGNGESPDSKRSKIVIPAHKFVLSVGSPVFFKMFCGEMAENGEQIDLPDCEHEGMLELLRYIYTDKAFLNGNNVMQVLYLSEKYIVPCLVKECVKFLKTNLDPSNVLCVLQHAQQYEKKNLLCHCWHLIERKAKEVLKSDEFVTMERSFLEELVIRDTLNIQEIELFKAVDRWAGKECERNGLAEEGFNKRKILGDQVVQNIRFPAMKQIDMDVVSGSKILTEKETSDVMNHFSSPPTSPVGFHDTERIGLCLRCCRSGSNNMGRKKYTHKSPYVTDLMVDKDILLYGVALFGDKNTQYSVTVKLLSHWGSHLAVKTGTYTSSHMLLETKPGSQGYYGFDVLFDVPVAMEKGRNYSLGTSTDGGSCCVKCWTGEDIDCVYDQRVVATFFFRGLLGLEDDEEELCGQIPELLFKLKD